MVTTTLALALTVLLQISSPAPVCWVDRGSRPDYGATAPFEELQQALHDGTPCKVWAVTWREPAVPRRASVLLWDGGREELVRLSVEGGTVFWERWRGATRDRLLLEDPADGVGLPGVLRGSGPAAVSPEARELIQQGAKGRFDSAIR